MQSEGITIAKYHHFLQQQLPADGLLISITHADMPGLACMHVRYISEAMALAAQYLLVYCISRIITPYPYKLTTLLNMACQSDDHIQIQYNVDGLH